MGNIQTRQRLWFSIQVVYGFGPQNHNWRGGFWFSINDVYGSGPQAISKTINVNGFSGGSCVT